VENHRRWGATVSDKMVELAQIRAGQKVLDIATVSVNLQLPQGKLSVKKVVSCYRYISRNVSNRTRTRKISGSTGFHGICSERRGKLETTGR
jgi:hypothetical protein